MVNKNQQKNTWKCKREKHIIAAGKLTEIKHDTHISSI